LLENVDGASAAWGAKVVWLVLAVVLALGAAYQFFGSLDTDIEDPSSIITIGVVLAIGSGISFLQYQASKLCVLSVFAGELTITDKINVDGLDSAKEFINALERAQQA
jgi:hypothetical protein